MLVPANSQLPMAHNDAHAHHRPSVMVPDTSVLDQKDIMTNSVRNRRKTRHSQATNGVDLDVSPTEAVPWNKSSLVSGVLFLIAVLFIFSGGYCETHYQYRSFGFPLGICGGLLLLSAGLTALYSIFFTEKARGNWIGGVTAIFFILALVKVCMMAAR
jgi:hypothetical protein